MIDAFDPTPPLKNIQGRDGHRDREGGYVGERKRESDGCRADGL